MTASEFVTVGDLIRALADHHGIREVCVGVKRLTWDDLWTATPDHGDFQRIDRPVDVDRGPLLCAVCGQPIELIPFGDGLWVHNRGEPDQSTLCDKGAVVVDGVMMTARPR